MILKKILLSNNFVFLLIIIISIISLIIIFRDNSKLFNSTKSLEKSLTQCQEDKRFIKNTACIKSNLVPLVVSRGVAYTIKFSKENNLPVSYDLKNNIDCHDYAHLLGSIAGETTKDVGESIDKCGDDCFSGCYHGFFEGIQKNSSVSIQDYENICLDTVSPGDLQSGCLHAQGHYFMELSRNMLSDGFDKCMKLKTTERNQKACLSGGFMQAQLLREDKIMTPSTPKMPDPVDYLNFCKKFTGLIQDYCLQDGGSYIYRFTLDPKTSTNFCIDHVKETDQEGCLSLVGGFFHRKNPDNYIQYILDHCRLAKDIFTSSCLEGGINSVYLGGQNIQPLIDSCLSQKILTEQECQKLSKINY